MWIVASDHRVLLQRRALVKESWPGLWDISVAGHLSAGETAVEGVIREALVRPEDFDQYERVPHDEEYALLFATLPC